MPGNDEALPEDPSADENEPDHTTADNEVGDDFDDFGAEGDDDDFGDFDDGFEQPSTESEPPRSELPLTSKSPFVSSCKYKASFPVMPSLCHIPPLSPRGLFS